MTVYTVSSTVEPPTTLMQKHHIVGSYVSRGDAIDAAVDYILERVERLHDVAYAMCYDYSHNMETLLIEDESGLVSILDREALRRRLRDELGGQGCYHVAGRSDRIFRFDINENDVVGELWHTVTWGDSDCEDPEFTTPWPEMFTSKDTAIKTFVNYAKEMMASQEMEVPEDFYAVVEQQLDEDGKCQVDLDDGSSVSCVLYHDDAKNVKE